MTVLTRAAIAAATVCASGALLLSSPGVATESAGAEIVARAIGATADVSLSTELATEADIVPAAAAAAATPTTPQTRIDTANPLAPTAFASLTAAVAAHDGVGAGLSDELECLAGATYFESKGEPLEGQLAVAEVIINRSESGRFPSSLCGVVHQRGQFSFVRGGRMPAIARGSRAWREAVAVAQVAHAEAWESRASNALFFHARRVSPGWRKARVATLGNHVFYR